MAQNFASKYSNKVDERFATKSLTEAATHQDYEWSGVDTVTVYSVDTVAMGDYTRSGTSRYGTATELGNTKKSYTIARDRSFTFTIDRGNQNDSMMVMESGKALGRQLKERIVPEIDTYRIAAWSAAAVANSQVPTATNITASNAYTSFLTAQTALDDNEIPDEGRICFATSKFINFLKQDPMFVKASDMGQKMVINGQVGEIDGVPIVKVPSNRMVAKTPFIIVHKSVTCAPKKLADYKTHDNPPGINGWLVEGRTIYDCFIMEAKKKGVYAWKEV